MTTQHYYDITDRIPVKLSNPQNQQNYYPTGVAYDVSIGGQPFFLLNDDNNPYRNVTAQYRKNQVDMSREPGEQTLTGWWLRSQSSFHLGQGIKFFEPQQDESLRFQYTYSKGCDIWEKGQVTLLPDTFTTHYTTGDLQPNKRPYQIMRTIRPSWTVTNKALTSNVATLTIGSHKLTAGCTIVVDNIDATFNGTYVLTTVGATTISYARTAANVTSVAASGLVTQNAVLLWDKYDVDKIDVGGQLIHFIDYTAGVNDPVFSICDDGTYAYWVTNDGVGGKLQVWKKLLTADSTTSGTLMFDKPGLTVTNAVIEYTKQRLVLCVNNFVYTFATSATSAPTSPDYTHPTDNFVYTSITSSGAAIYVTGFTGIQSTIQKFTLTTAGAMPTTTSAITAAELPVGEIVFRIYYYLGYMAIGTSLGLRMAAVSDTDGSLAYGPLIFESEQPVYDVAGYDKYLWCSTNVDGNPGVTRVDLGQQVGTNLVFAYAWDLYDPDTTGFTTTSCSFMGNTQQLAFCTANNGTTNGSNYIQDPANKIETGTIRTGFVRYNTVENKIFKYVVPKFDTTYGSLVVQSVDANGNVYGLGSFSEGQAVNQIGIGYPTGAQQYLGFQFTFTRYSVDATTGPTFTGYQVKALPAVPRQYLIQYPCSLFDSESDKYGNKAGYDGAAYNRLQAIQQIESAGDTIKVEDFRTGQVLTGIIEETDFINKTPSDKRYSGYGGLLLITIRTIS